ncbi:F0F1 ATP synthase subunit epsilon [Thermaerobacter sp. FW80]|uniref:F0F1 ATP synthase subunit epsilon n=1 Tax=Thermaerobacter sp. FW80 TaxID=2546351 RepID=UPI000DB40109|nr:F0F1 ATP synthase subunit epsilon [Thermaerobacter sp. FW80]PZN06742.1 MAG: F0F1 ATP synthase subunit epsilon [Bacillota bacterium]QBS37206.1 F0F1 ATP synthase subunit epsilon [Thermaerobacter sp. FW80]
MAERAITLEVITPERVVFREEVDSLIVPGSEGLLGVLPDHAPMVATLKIGILSYRKGGERRRVAVAGGFFEVADNHAVVLSDAAERAEEIDVARARAAAERARRRLAERDANWDFERARAALHRALNRLRAAGADTGDLV